jgi:hypothetical protein
MITHLEQRGPISMIDLVTAAGVVAAVVLALTPLVTALAMFLLLRARPHSSLRDAADALATAMRPGREAVSHPANPLANNDGLSGTGG